MCVNADSLHKLQSTAENAEMQNLVKPAFFPKSTVFQTGWVKAAISLEVISKCMKNKN